MKNTCYICGDTATTDEHVPPKCFFPKNYNLRKQLITVKSCERHNNKKSNDDEFFRTIVLLNYNNNQLGSDLFFGKTIRAVKRSPNRYGKFIKPIEKHFHSDEKAFQFDRSRFDRCVDYMVKAIFYHKYKLKWNSLVYVFCPSFGKLSNHSNYYLPFKEIEAVKLCRLYLQNEINLGDNPEIFKYRIKYDEAENFLCFGAQFYDSFEIFVLSSDKLIPRKP